MDLASGAKKRLKSAFRPKTQKYYQMLYRTFVAFCVHLDLFVFDVSVVHILSYLEYLVQNGVSANMLANHVSAAKANFTMYGLDYSLWEHPNIRYFLKSIKINRPIKITRKNVTLFQHLTTQGISLLETSFLPRTSLKWLSNGLRPSRAGIWFTCSLSPVFWV